MARMKLTETSLQGPMNKKLLKTSAFFAVTFLLAACSTRQQEDPTRKNAQFCGSYTPVPDTAKRDYTQRDPRYKVGKPYKIKGRWYYPCEDFEYEEVGKASWYGPGFHGKKSANGERYNMHSMTAAHRTLPLPSLVEVTNLSNNRKVVLKVNDRGPYAKDRIIDVSHAGAKQLGFIGHGTAQVRVRILKEESMRFAGLSTKNAPKSVGPRNNNNIKNQRNNSNNGLDERIDNTFPWQQPVQLAELSEKGDDAQIQRDLGYVPIPQKGGKIQSSVHKPQMPALAPVAPKIALTAPIQLASLKKEQFTPVDHAGTHITSTKPFYVQAGAFSNYENAQKFSQKLNDQKTAKFPPAFIISAHIQGKNIYRVRVGPAKTSLEANQLLGKMVHQGYSDAKIVSEG